jgi:hypothetical protein
MESGGAKRLTISAIAAALILGAIGGIAQKSAGYALQASGGDAWAYRTMVRAMDEAAHFLTSPLLIIIASIAAGAAMYSWGDLIIRKWSERWRLTTDRLSFGFLDRKLIAMTLMLFFGGGFALTTLWVTGELILSKNAPVVAPLADVNTSSTLIANATAIPPAKYNKAQIGKILEAIDVFHTLLLRIGRTLNDAKGMTGSLEGIVSSQGAASFLEQMNAFRLMYLSPSDDFDKAYQDYSLYTEVTRVVAEKQLHHDPLFCCLQ